MVPARPRAPDLLSYQAATYLYQLYPTKPLTYKFTPCIAALCLHVPSLKIKQPPNLFMLTGLMGYQPHRYVKYFYVGVYLVTVFRML